MTMASGLARLSLAASRPKRWKYSRSEGISALPMRSRWRRSIITTSQPSSPLSMSSVTSTPNSSMPAGIRVGGPIRRTRLSIAPSSRMLERATREWAMSPHMATVRRCRRPLARRMVSASSSACVGCSCRPSPAFSTAQSTFWASRSTAPEWGWRTTRMSGRIAFSVVAVSISVSPLATLLVCIAMFITSAPSRLPAISKLDWVRVEFSKNMLIWVLPASTSRAGPASA